MKSTVTALAVRWASTPRIARPVPARRITSTRLRDIVTDYGAIPGAVAGSAGPLGNVYISGSSTSATGGSLRASFDAVLIRRRINANATDHHHRQHPVHSHPDSLRAHLYCREPGVINNLGDLDLGAAVPAGSGGSAASNDTVTAATLTGNPASVTVKLTVAAAPPAGLVGKNVTVSGVVLAASLTSITSAATPVFTGTGTIYTVTFTTPTLAPLLAVGQTVTLSGATANTAYNASACAGDEYHPSGCCPDGNYIYVGLPGQSGRLHGCRGCGPWCR